MKWTPQGWSGIGGCWMGDILPAWMRERGVMNIFCTTPGMAEYIERQLHAIKLPPQVIDLHPSVQGPPHAPPALLLRWPETEVIMPSAAGQTGW